MKAEGKEYDERMAELEHVEYPKPNAEFVYATFNAFAAHPPLGRPGEHPAEVGGPGDGRAGHVVQRLRPGVRAAAERGRAPALPLRGLQDAGADRARDLPRRGPGGRGGLPAHHRPRRRLEPRRRVGAHALRPGPGSPGRPRAPPPAAPAFALDPATNLRGFTARVRAELHRLLGALGRRSYEEAATLVRQRPGEEWTPRRLEEAMAPYWAEHARIDVTPRARRPDNTFLSEVAPRSWSAVQRIVDEAGEVDWMIECADRSRGAPRPRRAAHRAGPDRDLIAHPAGAARFTRSRGPARATPASPIPRARR